MPFNVELLFPYRSFYNRFIENQVIVIIFLAVRPVHTYMRCWKRILEHLANNESLIHMFDDHKFFPARFT